MLKVAKILEIRRLLGQGLTQREVAAAAGVGAGSVFRAFKGLLAGRRPPSPATRRGTCDELPVGPVERCPQCGRKIEMPCRACLAEGHANLARDKG